MSRPFEVVHHVVADSISVTEVRGNYYDMRASPGDGASQLLQPHIAAGALPNSEDRCDAPKCHPDTRVAVQDSIVSWAAHSTGSKADPARNIMWVTGPAGTGKTAIAGSIAETCSKRGLLAGAFFFSSFSSDVSRRLKQYLIPTLAYQLVCLPSFQDVAREVALAIRQDPAIFDKRLTDQLEALIIRPLRVWRRTPAESSEIVPQVIIIDGLDECEAGRPHNPRRGKAARNNAEEQLKQDHRRKEEAQVEILETLLRLANEPAFPFRIILFSRPEPAIRRFFSHPTTKIFPEIFLDNQYDPDSDIALFLRAKFAEIRLRHPSIPASWPPEDVIKLLVEKASGQFIYVSTVIRFVDGPSRNPQLLLKQVLDSGMHADVKSPNPLAPLDVLYTSIMNRCPDPQLLATWIMVTEDHTPASFTTGLLGWRMVDMPRPAFFWKTFLSSYPGEADSLLEDVSSLLANPPREDLKTSFRFYHRSFGEFLSTPQRCIDLYISKERRTSLLVARLVQVLKAKEPACALTEREAQDFYDTFCVVIVRSSLLYDAIADPSAKADLLACDLLWWMQKLCNVPGVTFQGKKTSGCGAIYPWLENLHAYCNPLFCHPICNYWRRGAERFARDNGRFVPRPLWYLRVWVIERRRKRLELERMHPGWIFDWPHGLAIPFAKIEKNEDAPVLN
ncbi:hypothetical protein DFP72DRAFT_461290 [Ephemerocybe angulata]|uniref:Nephrocystin 3-like N-terminal domain-containing protein n=1 Tax=Ephemerocybe angulata TaxID=980116 RepID=A0A8H6HUE8_9AGAR|nr:hypothetical protein DFP72DRAFT_461290 [Tulosesus angulatus]